jgi:hypothetical protein
VLCSDVSPPSAQCRKWWASAHCGGRWQMGRPWARHSGFLERVSQDRPPNRTCDFHRIQLSTKLFLLGCVQ